MIYLDNAATTLKKPDCVVKAVIEAMNSLGNSGRGVHEASLNAARTVFGLRNRIADFFGTDSPARVAFTPNSTVALNIAIKGTINSGDHIITTVMEHNSVIRPLYEMEMLGAEIDFVECDQFGRPRYEQFNSLVKDNTKAIVCTCGSNLTGILWTYQKLQKLPKQIILY